MLLDVRAYRASSRTPDGKPFLIKDPKLLLNDNDAGKPEGIHFMIGQRPHAAFGKFHRRARCSNTPQAAAVRGCDRSALNPQGRNVRFGSVADKEIDIF